MLRTILVLLAVESVLHADERGFLVAVDGKPAGKFAITFKSFAEDVTEIRATIDFSDNALYPLQYEGTERWRGRNLVRLDCSGSEYGQKGGVFLVSGKDGYALKAGAKEVTVRGDVWPTSFWIRPAPEKPLIVDVLTGTVSRGKLDKVGPEQMQVDGKLIRVTKYRLTFAGATTELWYDQADRLTRRKCEVNGRMIVMELTSMKSD
jgi:hypothetical protein